MATIRKATAKDGCVWKIKSTGMILSEVLYLGNNDSIENYEQIEKPQEEIAEQGE